MGGDYQIVYTVDAASVLPSGGILSFAIAVNGITNLSTPIRALAVSNSPAGRMTGNVILTLIAGDKITFINTGSQTTIDFIPWIGSQLTIIKLN